MLDFDLERGMPRMAGTNAQSPENGKYVHFVLRQPAWAGLPGCHSLNSLLTAAALLPLVAVVVRHRGPSKLGLVPNGGGLPDVSHPVAALRRTRKEAMATAAFWTRPRPSPSASRHRSVFCSPSEFGPPCHRHRGRRVARRRSDRVRQPVGRLLLARIVAEMPVRRYTAAIFGAQAVALIALALPAGLPR